MSYAVCPLCEGFAFNLERPYKVDQFLGRAFRIIQSSWPGLPLVMILSATQSVRKKRPPPALACISKHWPPAYGGWCFFCH